ncbi:MAG: L-histidine N(alpha)-methyltransferase [Bacteroidetes bacterium]|nr:L-histidine N(alpha)-methyltransferase [Bacteroidota bacterium]
MNQFFQNVWKGLNSSPKYLESKYFYDEAGDKIFEEIMECPEYYLTNCEREIFQKQTAALTDKFLSQLKEFDVVELGAGSAAKTSYLLKHMVSQGIDFTYYPIDISGNVISNLTKNLPAKIPGLILHGLNGDYFDMLDELKLMSDRNKVVLFLGSSIGNINLEDTEDFFRLLRSHLLPGDMVLIGFDLKKDPQIILAAYNDKEGITKRFNLNLLKRINKDLDADFDITAFEHKPVYDAETGACKSYLVSSKNQSVRIGEVGRIQFNKGESIYMEISQKYTVAQTDTFAINSGFKPVHHFFDSKNWFLDTLWQAV